MPRVKSDKPKRNVWKDPSPYGTYQGERGNPEQWKTFFNFAWTKQSAGLILEQLKEKKTPYELLGITITATLQEIKTAFRKLMLIHHPDKGGDPEICRNIIAAYVFLTEK